jgi:hypothetical protein
MSVPADGRRVRVVQATAQSTVSFGVLPRRQAGPTFERARKMGRIGIPKEEGNIHCRNLASQYMLDRLGPSDIVHDFLEREAPVPQPSLQRANGQVLSCGNDLDVGVSVWQTLLYEQADRSSGFSGIY